MIVIQTNALSDFPFVVYSYHRNGCFHELDHLGYLGCLFQVQCFKPGKRSVIWIGWSLY